MVGDNVFDVPAEMLAEVAVTLGAPITVTVAVPIAVDASPEVAILKSTEDWPVNPDVAWKTTLVLPELRFQVPTPATV